MLSLNNIDKSFLVGNPDENHLFKSLNLTIGKGEFISIIGNNGAGKSSLLNIIMGVVELDSGEILLGQRNISKLSTHKRAKMISRVFQWPDMGTCPSMTVIENLSLAYKKHKGFSLSLVIKKNEISLFKGELERLGLGLENKLNTQVGNLSGGQKQGLSLLMATLSNPEILLLDEHTAALDPKASEEIMSLTNMIVKEKGITTIMVTHNLRNALDYGNRLVMLQQGEIILDVAGKEKSKLTPENLLNKFLYTPTGPVLPEKMVI